MGLMFSKLAISLLCFLVSPGNACESKSRSAQTAQETMSTANTPSVAALDACTLIEKSEIASVQGVQVQQTQPTSQTAGELNISQCYYTVIDGSKNLSVFVQVIQRDPKSASANALKEFWEKKVVREGEEHESKEKSAAKYEEEEELGPSLRVSGIGDEAFWLGSSRGGALYVLKKDKLLRVSVGGTDDAKANLEKSKTLAKKALARLM
jgi:hypothetical protein